MPSTARGWVQSWQPPAGILPAHEAHNSFHSKMQANRRWEKLMKTRFWCCWKLWSWVFNSFGQVCVPSFDCREFMLVTLMNLGLESAAVKLVRCLLELNIGKSDKMSSWVPFLWFYEQIPACIWTYRTFASIKTVCWWLLEGVNRAVKWHFHYSETLESCVPSLVVPLHCECYSFVTG